MAVERSAETIGLIRTGIGIQMRRLGLPMSILDYARLDEAYVGDPIARLLYDKGDWGIKVNSAYVNPEIQDTAKGTLDPDQLALLERFSPEAVVVLKDGHVETQFSYPVQGRGPEGQEVETAIGFGVRRDMDGNPMVSTETGGNIALLEGEWGVILAFYDNVVGGVGKVKLSK